MITFIIKTKDCEYYCNTADNILQAVGNYKQAKKPYWSDYKNRKQIDDVIYFKGDHKAKIKRFGIKTFYNITKNTKFFRLGL